MKSIDTHKLNYNKLRLFTLSLLLLLNFQVIWSQADIEYNYNRVSIGSGGYITGIMIHPSNGEVRYYRTDVGGAYRYNEITQSVEQIIFHQNSELYSIAGIALDSTDEDRLAIAAGRKCSSTNSAIFISSDKGRSWDEVIIPGEYGTNIYFAANGGRDCGGSTDKDRQGNCIAFNPLNPDELYIGSREKGLWKLEISTHTFTRLGWTPMPNNTNRKSIRTITFDPNDPTRVLVAYAGHGLYLGNTTNNTYTKISTGLPDLEDIAHFSISKNGDYLLAACQQKGLYKCSNYLSNNRSWVKVMDYLPVNSQPNGFIAVACSPHNNNVALTVNSEWNGGMNSFHKTINAGASWTTVSGSIGTNIFPYKTHGFLSVASVLAFDPDDAKKVHIGSWFGSYETADWTQNPIVWTNQYMKGHEEIVSNEIVSFPSTINGSFLYVGSADHSGFLKNTLHPDVFPVDLISSRTNNSSNMLKTATFAASPSNSNHLYSVTMKAWRSDEVILAKSSDGGTTFVRSTGFDETKGKTYIAVSSGSPDNILILNRAGLFYSHDGGQSFNSSTSSSNNNSDCSDASAVAPRGVGTIGPGQAGQSVFSLARFIASDQVASCVFYHYNMTDGSFNLSTDGGETFFKVNSGTLPNFQWGEYSHKSRIITVPDHAGHLYMNFTNGLYFSTDFGRTFQQINNVSSAISLDVGPNVPGASYPTLFLLGRANGSNIDRFYVSIDQGNTWHTITDPDNRQLWGNANLLVADKSEVGRYYIGLAGHGVIYGEADLLVLPLRAPLLTGNREGDVDYIFIEIVQNQDIDQIVLEASGDGNNFSPIQIWEDVEIDDRLEFRLKVIGDQYYRVKLIGPNEEVIYSDIFLLESDQDSYDLVREGESRLRLIMGNEKEHRVTVSDVAGKQVHSFSTREKQVLCDLSDLDSGIYIISVRNQSGRAVLVKKVAHIK